MQKGSDAHYGVSGRLARALLALSEFLVSFSTKELRWNIKEESKKLASYQYPEVQLGAASSITEREEIGAILAPAL